MAAEACIRGGQAIHSSQQESESTKEEVQEQYFQEPVFSDLLPPTWSLLLVPTISKLGPPGKVQWLRTPAYGHDFLFKP